MVEYIVVILVLLYGFVQFDVKGNSDNNNRWLIFEWILIVLLAGMRYKVGGDTLAYYNYFEDKWPTLSTIKSYDFEHYGILWVYFAATCKSIINDFAFLQFVHAIIVNSIFFWFFKTHSKHYFTIILVFYIGFFFRYNTEVMRGALSVCSFLVGFDYMMKRKWIVYYLTCFISLGFHSEGICTFFFPIILMFNKISLSRFSVFVFFIFSFIVLIFTNITPYIHSILIHTRFSDEFVLYSAVNAQISFLGYIHILILAVPVVIVMLLHVNDKKYMYSGLLFLYLLLTIIEPQYTHIISRPMDFLRPIFVILMIESLLQSASINTYRNNRLFNILIISIFLSSTVSFIINNWILFYPYSSILDPIETPLREVFFELKFQ